MKINSKKKGNLWENKFAQFLVKNGIKAWKDGASGGGLNEKADVGNNINIHFEVKAVKKINLKEVWYKAEYECTKTHNTPVIAIHFDGMPEDKFLMVIDNDFFINLLTGESVANNDYQDPKFKYALKNLKESINTVFKFLD